MSRVCREPRDPIPCGRLDKLTGLKELQAKGFLVPPIFASIEEAVAWREAGGQVIFRPYFSYPWDSAIFLPGLDSVSFNYSDYPDDLKFDLRTDCDRWRRYIADLWEKRNLSGYLQQFGVFLQQPPEVSYILQACVNRGVQPDGQPIRTNLILMNNQEYTHIERQTTGYRARSSVYQRTSHKNLEFFEIIPIGKDEKGIEVEEVLSLFRQITAVFNRDKNIQVELAYGFLKPDERSQLYVVQVRDFPQIGDRLWDYHKSFGTDYEVMGRSRLSYRDAASFFQLDYLYNVSEVKVRRDRPGPYVLCVEQYGWEYEDLLDTFPGMRGLWLQDKWSRVPLIHGLFSLVELAHIHGGKVLLG